MITRVELINFMSHKHTVIEPAAGLTVLVGPNNVGKSAVVAALQILCRNENSTYVLRHGERECSVRVHTDDGHVVEWRRKNSPSYVIDGQTFDRLGRSGLPDELHAALRLSKVDAASDTDFDVHFGTQKSPIFLLGNSAANAARFFASSSDAIRLVTIQKRHKEKLSEAQREKNRLEAESRHLNAELEVLEPAVEIDHRLETTEHAYDELLQLRDWLRELTKHEAALREQADVVARRAAYAEVLAPLAPPPTLVPVEPLTELITGLEVGEKTREEATSRADALAALAAPPELAPIEVIANLIRALESAEERRDAAASCAEALTWLPSPPEMHELASLTELAEKLATHVETVERGENEWRRLSRLSDPPELADTNTLQRLVDRLAAAGRELTVVGSRDAVLSTITPPPELSNPTPLQTLLSSLIRTTNQADRWEKECATLAIVTPPQVPTETRGIDELVSEMERAIAQVRTCAGELEVLQTDLTLTEDALREQAAGSICPICGTALDPDRVIARAAELGGHDHG